MQDWEVIQETTNDAAKLGRVACDLWNVLKKSNISPMNLSPETLKWVGQHDKEDQERLRRERKNGVEESIKQRALSKLDQDERKALGL